MDLMLYYAGSGMLFLWGAAHLFPTKAVVGGFGEISGDNRLIITMEWIAEGLALCFIGALVAASAMFGDIKSATFAVVINASVLMLFAMAVLSFFTGFKTSIIPVKICPFVKLLAAAVFIAARLMAR
jgi:hypothetical protein